MGRNIMLSAGCIWSGILVGEETDLHPAGCLWSGKNKVGLLSGIKKMIHNSGNFVYSVSSNSNLPSFLRIWDFSFLKMLWYLEWNGIETIEGINETIAISKGWLRNRQGFPVKYYFRGSGAEAELEISSETRRAWPCKITMKATVPLRGFYWYIGPYIHILFYMYQ